MKSMLCCALFVAASATAAWAGDCCESCQHCGCQTACQKVCRLVCETKKVPKVTYSCQCEDFCIPGPSQRCRVCDCDCDCNSHCGHKYAYTPTCASLHTRAKLVKHETMEEKPSYKWIVETVCNSCCAKCTTGAQPAPEASPVPPPVAPEEIDTSERTASYYAPTAPTSESVRKPSAPERAPKGTLRRMLGPLSIR